MSKEYNEMCNRELEELGLKTRITSVPEEFALTPGDIAELDSLIQQDVMANEEMMKQSYIEASKRPLA